MGYIDRRETVHSLPKLRIVNLEFALSALDVFFEILLCDYIEDSATKWKEL